MKITVNGAQLMQPPCGVRNFSEEFIKRLMADPRYLIRIVGPADRAEYADQHQIALIDRVLTPPSAFSHSFLAQSLDAFLWETVQFPAIVRQEPPAVVLCTFQAVFQKLPTDLFAIVPVIHDVIQWDPAIQIEPPLHRFIYDQYRSACQKVDHILTVSQFSKREIMRVAAIPADKITVIYEGIAPAFMAAPSIPDPTWHALPMPYILATGGIAIRKNVYELLQAFRLLRAKKPELHLILTGSFDHLKEKYPAYFATCEALLKDPSLRDAVHVVQPSNQAELIHWYRGAACVAYLSEYEGFGLPVLESFATDVPIVASNLSSIPEVAGDAALLVNPHELDTVVGALTRVIDDLSFRQLLITKGRQQLQLFTWDRTLQLALPVLEKLASRSA